MLAGTAIFLFARTSVVKEVSVGVATGRFVRISGVDYGQASVFSVPSVDLVALRKRYQLATSPGAEKVRVLIVPGHEPGFGGAEYKDLKEREMNIELANKLQALFQADTHYEVSVARSGSDWLPSLKEFFVTKWDDIVVFQTAKRKEMKSLLVAGSATKVSSAPHSNALAAVATRLYGINKWANDHKIDIAIHVHFNEYPRTNATKPGIYNGFAIYVPEAQFSNAPAAKEVAQRVFRRLSSVARQSNYPYEADGVVEDQALIAVGANNSVDAASMLIEYGYIYEPQFATEAKRQPVFTDYAATTYAGVKDFFEGVSVVQ
ncbi:MAG: N-acetylmuramoyl-L-alanine amidase [bacterium]